jgi:hypothetical protein
LTSGEPGDGHGRSADWGPPRVEGIDNDLWELQADGSYTHPKYQNLRWVKPKRGRARVIFLGTGAARALKAQLDKRRQEKED